MEIDRIVIIALLILGPGHLDVLSKEQAWSESDQEQCSRAGEQSQSFLATDFCWKIVFLILFVKRHLLHIIQA